jgi:hypothetical protein
MSFLIEALIMSHPTSEPTTYRRIPSLALRAKE